jgi:hypothetical protein
MHGSGGSILPSIPYPQTLLGEVFVGSFIFVAIHKYFTIAITTVVLQPMNGLEQIEIPPTFQDGDCAVVGLVFICIRTKPLLEWLRSCGGKSALEIPSATTIHAEKTDVCFQKKHR